MMKKMVARGCPRVSRLISRGCVWVGLTYYAAGSNKMANDVWRGGVLLGSLGEANKRMEGLVDHCRG